MAVTKTDFLNFTRCKRYFSLEDIKLDKLNSNVTIEEYKHQEDSEAIKEILDSLFNELDEDVTKKVDKQLEAMMSYYKEVEILTAKKINAIFGGKTIYSEKTYNQESFDFEKNGIRYLCYVDIYNETDDEINIIEVKATTSKAMLDITYGKGKTPLFVKSKDIYTLAKCEKEEDQKSYYEKIGSLTDRFRKGRYIYDLAVQRYFIENDHKSHAVTKKTNYYLAVLNHEYIYDGYKENGDRVYKKDLNGNDIISIFDMNEITSSLLEHIDEERKKLESFIFTGSSEPCKLGIACDLKGRTECKFKEVCFKSVPRDNASYNYKCFRGFKDLNGNKYDKYELINEGYYKLDDIPVEWLKSQNHLIQRECYDNNKTHINKEKIKCILNDIKYPIYHLDFETFPCPIPRFKGERPYTQSPFEFSLHIEWEPGVCDKESDNFVFLADTFEDERENLIKALLSHIDTTKGTMLAQNVGFERSVLKHLASVFPEYKAKLSSIIENSTDLLYFLDTNKEFFKAKGFDEEEASMMNYYNSRQSGSFSIKKTLPLFTSLNYEDLEIQNGNDALSIYASYNKLSDKELNIAKANLIKYCQQDTWAMVEILKGLRELIK